MKENKEKRGLEDIYEFAASRVVSLGSAKSISQQVRLGQEEAGHSCLMLSMLNLLCVSNGHKSCLKNLFSL